MTKLGNLFDLSKFDRRKTANQEAFEKLHKEEMPIFGEIMSEAFERTKDESSQKAERYKDKNYHAVIMSGYIRGLLLERFPENVKVGMNDRIMFSKKGAFCLYFKKLDDRKMPSNVATEYSELVAHQRTIPGGDKMPIIFIGYTVDDSWSSLTGVYAVYIEDRSVLWVTEIATNQAVKIANIDSNKREDADVVAPRSKRVRRRKSS